MKILIAHNYYQQVGGEDHCVTAEAAMLQDNGHEVPQAENGADAVRQYAEHRPDAVLLDITMPEMDGLQALKEIRKIA